MRKDLATYCNVQHTHVMTKMMTMKHMVMFVRHHFYLLFIYLLFINQSIYSLTLSVSVIHILVFHLLTTLHKSDPHCHNHLCHHQSLLLFFTLDLKHTSTSSHFHRRLHHRYTGLISRTLGRTVFLLLIGFVLVFSSRLSAVD